MTEYIPDAPNYINLCVEIRRNADDKIVKSVWEHWDFHVFWWSEGNACCDCNRGIFFHRAEGIEVEDKRCGHTRYDVRLTNADTLEVLYDEFEMETIQARQP